MRSMNSCPTTAAVSSERMSRLGLLEDPLGYPDGLNTYLTDAANPINWRDPNGTNRYRQDYMFPFQVQHVALAVDNWKCDNGKWVRIGTIEFDFKPRNSNLYVLWDITCLALAPGEISEVAYGPKASPANYFVTPSTWFSSPSVPLKVISSNPWEDLAMIRELRKQEANPAPFSLIFNNCEWWVWQNINDGIGADPRGSGKTKCSACGAADEAAPPPPPPPSSPLWPTGSWDSMYDMPGFPG